MCACVCVFAKRLLVLESESIAGHCRLQCVWMHGRKRAGSGVEEASRATDTRTAEHHHRTTHLNAPPRRPAALLAPPPSFSPPQHHHTTALTQGDPHNQPRALRGRTGGRRHRIGGAFLSKGKYSHRPNACMPSPIPDAVCDVCVAPPLSIHPSIDALPTPLPHRCKLGMWRRRLAAAAAGVILNGALDWKPAGPRRLCATAHVVMLGGTRSSHPSFFVGTVLGVAGSVI